MKNQISLIFDIDDTLYSQLDLLLEACQGALGGQKLPDPELFYRVFCRRSDEMFRASESGAVSIRQSRLYRISNTMADLGIPFTAEMAEDFQRRYAEAQDRLTLSDILYELLDNCSVAGIQMGIVSNGPDAHQRKKYHSLGLDRWIPKERVFISESVGCAKPGEGIFRRAEAQLGLRGDSTYMVGDSFRNDMEGAMQVGWRTIWVNYHGYPLPEGKRQPDHVVYSQKELRDVVYDLIHSFT